MALKKRGMLLTEETLKIVVAVIALGLLIYFLAGLYYSATGEKKARDARSTVAELSDVINGLSSSSQEVFVLQPQKWILFSFTGEEKKPDSCIGENCLCICANVLVDLFDRQIKKCDKNGACLAVPNLQEFEDIKIEPYQDTTTNVNVEELNGKIIISKT